jgi:aryl-alcohol dehydrogenase-like predicted oxidoreductase
MMDSIKKQKRFFGANAPAHLRRSCHNPDAMSPLQTIPNSELAVSPICLGAASLGVGSSRREAFALLDAYVDAGGNFIDTARVYSDWIPGESQRSEKIIGEWLAARGQRSRIVIATKGAHPDLKTPIPRVTPAAIDADLAESLHHLRTDCIDLYWLHRDDPTQPVGPIIDALERHRSAGRIRAYGCSNWTPARIRAAAHHAAAVGAAGFCADQPMWNAAVIDASAIHAQDASLVVMDRTLHDLHTETGMACIPYSSQAGGLFAKLAADSDKASSSRTYPIAPNRKRLAVLQHIAQSGGWTLTQVTLGYLLSQPFPTIPIVGCRTVEQLADSLSAVDVRLSPHDVAAIDAAG